MATFKDFLKEDIRNVFFNNCELSDKHLIDGEEMDVIIDANELIDREKGNYLDGVYKKRFIIYVKADQFGSMPKIGSELYLDNKSYTVCDVADEKCTYSITLENNKS